MVSFPQAVKMFFSRSFDFQGRSSRSEYWWAQLFIVIVFVLLMAFAVSAYSREFEGVYESGIPINFEVQMSVLGLFLLVIIIPNIALSVRRFHDLNQTGWLVLAFWFGARIPMLGILVFLANIIVFIMRGSSGPNDYGDDPLNPHSDLGVFD